MLFVNNLSFNKMYTLKKVVSGATTFLEKMKQKPTQNII